MSEEPVKKTNSIKSQFSAEAIAAGGGIIGLLTLALLIYQNYLMADQTAEMIATNKEMIFQRKIQERERFNHLIEVLYDTREDKPVYKSSYNREIKEARYNSRMRTEAFHEMVDYFKRENRPMDFSGTFLGSNIDFRSISLISANFEGADLRDANLEGCTLKEANFKNTDFLVANLSNGDFSHSDFTKAILYKTNLSKANLTGVNFKGTIFRETNLSNANLEGADLSGAILVKANLDGANLKNISYDGNTVWPEGMDLISNDLEFKMNFKRSEK